MSWTNESKESSTYDSGAGFLSQEDASYILMEDGGKIILDQSTNNKEASTYTDDTKVSSTYTNESK